MKFIASAHLAVLFFSTNVAADVASCIDSCRRTSQQYKKDGVRLLMIIIPTK